MKPNKEMQIEEMANVYEEARYIANETIGSMNEGAGKWYAKAFYNAGYRKVADVALEVIGEMEEHLSALDRRYMANGNPKQSWGVRGALAEVAELKRKYKEEVK